MLAPQPQRRTQAFDPQLESVRAKVRATLRQLRGPVPGNTDSAFFRLAKKTRMEHQAFTEADLEEDEPEPKS